MKDKILDILIYILTIATLIIMLIVQKDLTKIAWTIGIGATIIGFLVILKKNNYGYLIFSPGFSLFMAVLLYYLKILDKYESVTFMICLSICILMIITLIATIIGCKKVEQIYDKVIEATVVDLVKNPNTQKEYYQVMYEYIVGKNVYTVGTPDYINKFIPKIGDKLKIRISSKDFEDVFFDKRPLDKIYETGLTIGLIIVTIIIIISLFI